jgi:hypothetical protein
MQPQSLSSMTHICLMLAWYLLRPAAVAIMACWCVRRRERQSP